MAKIGIAGFHQPPMNNQDGTTTKETVPKS
jgi:hypothetical protein